MKMRTESEMKAYVDGYNACFKQFIEYLKGINENPLHEIVSNMYDMKAAVNAVVERDDEHDVKGNAREV